LAASEVPQALPQIELDLTDARSACSDEEDSDDDKDSHEKCEHDIEPVSRDAIKLPAGVKWSDQSSSSVQFRVITKTSLRHDENYVGVSGEQRRLSTALIQLCGHS
jgi:hypothetical protein